MPHIITRLAQFLMPHFCLLCDKRGTLLCQTCENNLPWLTTACKQCGKSMPSAMTCLACLKKPPPYQQTFVCFHYTPPINTWITHYKFQGALYLSPLFATLMARIKLPDFDAILPVPLASARLGKRGYNQATLLASQLAKKYHKPILHHHVVRIRNTPAQSGLSRQARKKNLRGAFVVKKPIQVKKILIIDDVITTASTIHALASCLKKAGVEHVLVFALAGTSME